MTMDLHEKLRIIGKAFSWEKVTQGQARSAAPHITTAADRLEVLEIEHAEFFERWHGERRKREALELLCRQLYEAERDKNQKDWTAVIQALEKVGAGDTPMSRLFGCCRDDDERPNA